MRRWLIPFMILTPFSTRDTCSGHYLRSRNVFHGKIDQLVVKIVKGHIHFEILW